MPAYEPVPHPLRWWWLSGALLGVLAIGIASTTLGPVVPLITRDLTLSSHTLEWVIGVTALGLAVLVVPGVVLGDLLGHARVYLLGAAGFTLASLLGTVAGDGGTLVAARLLQGLAAGLVLPQVIGYARAHLPRVERALACGLFGLVFVAGTAFGPALGARLADATGWRSAFWIVVPAGALAAAAAIPVAFARPDVRVDPWALLLAAGAVPATAGIMLPVTARAPESWPIWYLFPFVLGGLLLAGCVALEMVRRGVRSGLGVPLVVLLAVVGAAPHLSTIQLYAQVAGLSTEAVTTALLPAAAGAAVGAAIAAVLGIWAGGRFAAALGAGVIAVGAVVQLANLDIGRVGEGVLAFGAAATGLGLALVVAGVLYEDLGTRPASTPAVGFAMLVLGTPVGVALYRLLAPPTLVVEDGLEAFHDATVTALILSIGLLAAAAVIALGLALVRPHQPQPRTDLTSSVLENVASRDE